MSLACVSASSIWKDYFHTTQDHHRCMQNRGRQLPNVQINTEARPFLKASSQEMQHLPRPPSAPGLLVLLPGYQVGPVRLQAAAGSPNPLQKVQHANSSLHPPLMVTTSSLIKHSGRNMVPELSSERAALRIVRWLHQNAVVEPCDGSRGRSPGIDGVFLALRQLGLASLR